jgi:putative oxidoreductase
MIAPGAAFADRISLAIQLRHAIAVLHRFPLSILQLAFRIAIAAVFWSSGLTKIASWDTTIALFRDEYRVPLLPPELAAAVSATFELSCSTLIIVGLATRLATLPLLGMTFVIEVFVYPEYWAMHLMWTSILLFLLTRGPGLLSLDHYVGRLFHVKGRGTVTGARHCG